jgi:hypothetical protein
LSLQRRPPLEPPEALSRRRAPPSHPPPPKTRPCCTPHVPFDLSGLFTNLHWSAPRRNAVTTAVEVLLPPSALLQRPHAAIEQAPGGFLHCHRLV